MKEKIVQTAIKLLNRSGVKFTISDIAVELKISKKTVYKYYESKEDLASEVFNEIIGKAVCEQQSLKLQNISAKEKLFAYLTEYMEIYRLASEEIFNLFSLSNQLRAGVSLKAAENWNGVEESYFSYCKENKLAPQNISAVKTVIEGTMEKIYHKENRKELLTQCLTVIFG